MKYWLKRKKDSQLCKCQRSCLDKLYKSMTGPLLDYCDVIYDSCTMYESEQLDKIQTKASLLCTGALKITSNEKVLK